MKKWVMILLLVFVLSLLNPTVQTTVIYGDTKSACESRASSLEKKGLECIVCQNDGGRYWSRCEGEERDFNDGNKKFQPGDFQRPRDDAYGVYTEICDRDSDCIKGEVCKYGFCTAKKGDYGNPVDLKPGDIEDVLEDVYPDSDVIKDLKCSDGTPINSCSQESKGKWCDPNFGLYTKATFCGCPEDSVQDPIIRDACVRKDKMFVCDVLVGDQLKTFRVSGETECKGVKAKVWLMSLNLWIFVLAAGVIVYFVWRWIR